MQTPLLDESEPAALEVGAVRFPRELVSPLIESARLVHGNELDEVLVDQLLDLLSYGRKHWPLGKHWTLTVDAIEVSVRDRQLGLDQQHYIAQLGSCCPESE